MRPEPRRFTGDRLVLATHNLGKVEEFRLLLRPAGVEVVTVGSLGLPVPAETGTTFEANARLKAVAAVTATGLPALADDSGLEVAGLDGAPGVYSADWAGPNRDFGHAMKRVLDGLHALRGGFALADNAAAFVAVLCLAWPDGHDELVSGRVMGTIVPQPRGQRGFGYDPIFVPKGYTETFGQMDPVAKLAMSHRTQAVARLMARCFPDHASLPPQPARVIPPGMGP